MRPEHIYNNFIAKQGEASVLSHCTMHRTHRNGHTTASPIASSALRSPMPQAQTPTPTQRDTVSAEHGHRTIAVPRASAYD